MQERLARQVQLAKRVQPAKLVQLMLALLWLQGF